MYFVQSFYLLANNVACGGAILGFDGVRARWSGALSPLPDWAQFLNTWIELKRGDGTIDALYSHWILGKQAVKRQPRWSIMRNVLHWTD